MRYSLIALSLLFACTGKEAKNAPKPAQNAPEPASKAIEEPPEQASPARAMAEKVVAALASDDYQALEAVLSTTAKDEKLGKINQRTFRELREKFAADGIDLSKAKIERVVEEPGMSIITVEIYLSYEGRGFHFHFNVMTIGGVYDYLGHAQWFKWNDESEEGVE
jgi:predicted lipid-binding transport protein (Tim44 family)